jgi:type I restriction enzyme, S subunit
MRTEWEANPSEIHPGVVMKQIWQNIPLGEICEFVRGPFGGSLKKSNFVEDGYAVYEQQHAIYDQFEIVRYFINEKKFKEMNRFEVSPNDLIMSCSGTMGKVAIIPEGIKRGIINQALLKLTPSPKLHTKFLKLWMESKAFQDAIREYSGGAAIQNVASVKILKEIKIPLPPLSEQQRIVAILDEAFATIDAAKANAEKNLQNSHELFETYLNNIFANPGEGWIVKKLGNICENLDNKREPVTKRDRDKGHYPYYGASGIVDYVNDFIFDEDLLLVSEDGANLLARTYPIAFSIKGKVWVNNHAHVLRFRNIATQKFVEFFLNSIRIDDYVNGMAQPKLNQKMLNSIKIPLPDLDTQEHIVSIFEKLQIETNKLKDVYQQQQYELDELKKSLLQKAFNGELTEG